MVVKQEDVLGSAATHRLQLVHEFDQELAALRGLAVQLHAGLHGIESTCGMERASHEYLRSKKNLSWTILHHDAVKERIGFC